MHKVGYIEGVGEDSHRSNWSGDGPRPLAWAAWYPAADSAQDKMKYIGPPGFPLFVMGSVAAGVPLENSAGQRPVVLLSHGTGGSAQGMGWLGCRLAAEGFIVLAANHHGNTAVEAYLPEGFLCWWERALDLTALLEIHLKGGLFAGKIDISRVYAAGFSLGGYTVLALAGAITDVKLFDEWANGLQGQRGPREFPDIADHIPDLLATSAVFRASQDRQGHRYLDPRVKAVFTFAPAPPVRNFTVKSLASIDIPVGIMAGASDAEAPCEDCAIWLANQILNCNLMLLEENAVHYVFLCEATENGRVELSDICIDAKGVSRAAIHQKAADAAIKLFRLTEKA